MASPFSRILFSLILFSSFARASGGTYDAWGRPILDEKGGYINYSAPAAIPLAPRSIPAAATLAGSPASTPQPFWQYGIFGASIGATGIHIQGEGADAEIILGGTTSGDFGRNDFWYVLRWATNANTYEKVFISRTYASTIGRIAYGSVITNSARQIVIALTSGEILLHDSVTRALLSRVLTASPLNAICLADLDQDGLDEILAVNEFALRVYNGAGALLWSVPGVGGYDVVAGQMDGDAAIEIAVGNGHIIDGSAHAVQWTYNGSTANRLMVANLDDDEEMELIAAQPWYWIYAYDVDYMLPKWSLHTDNDIAAINVADVDGDSTPELLVGDGQSGSIHIHDLQTRARKWRVSNPAHGVTWIAVGDVDDDAAHEVLWGAGGTSTGPDHLYVADGQSHNIQWSSDDIGGRFIGTSIADLDGDGRLELVACTANSNAAFDSGVILVFDVETGRLRATSAPIARNFSWTGPHDLKLRDLNGDGRPEIVIATDQLYNGYIEAYSFSTDNVFTVVWTNADTPSGEPFSAVDVQDLDGDGVAEIIVGNNVVHSGANGIFIRILDYQTRTELKRSLNLANRSWIGVSHVMVDISSGAPLIVARADETIYVFNGADLELLQILNGSYSAFAPAPDRNGFMAVQNGTAIFFRIQNGLFVAAESWVLKMGAVNSITWSEPNALWFNSAGVLARFDLLLDDITWSLNGADIMAGRYIGSLNTPAGETVYLSDRARLMGFHVEQKRVSVTMSKSRTDEPDRSPTTVRFHRLGETNESLVAMFDLSGSADRDLDYVFSAETNTITFRPGDRDMEFSLEVVDDALLENDETVVVTVHTEGLDEPSSAVLSIVSDDARVTFSASSSVAWMGREPVCVTFTREGPTHFPLFLDVRLSGTAVFGVDFAGDTNRVAIPPGQLSTDWSLYALTNAAPESVIEISLASGTNYTAPTNAVSVLIDKYPPPCLVSVSAEQSATEGNEGQEPCRFRIFRDGPLEELLTVYFNLSGSAMNGRDYQALSPWIVFPAGESVIYFDAFLIDDRIAEPSETMTLRLQPGPGYRVHTSLAEASVFILDDEAVFEIVGCVLNEPNAQGRRFVTARVAAISGQVSKPLSLLLSWQENGPSLRPRTHFRRFRFPANAVEVSVDIPLSKRAVDHLTLRLRPDPRVRPRFSVGQPYDFTFPTVPVQ